MKLAVLKVVQHREGHQQERRSKGSEVASLAAHPGAQGEHRKKTQPDVEPKPQDPNGWIVMGEKPCSCWEQQELRRVEERVFHRHVVHLSMRLSRGIEPRIV